MISIKPLIAWFALLSAALQVMPCRGQERAIIPGDFPDPTVIRADGRYYAIGTSSEWGPHFPVYVSDDLKNWNQTGFVFETPPSWASSSFWAPEYFYHDGLYYVYYSARRKEDGVSCIGVATSVYPDRGFVDKGIVVDYGSESIDAFVVREGQDLYMTWKAYGLDERPIELVGSKLSPDGLRLEGEPFSLLMDTARVGIEGQSFVRHDGYYYMFYSAGSCCGLQCDYHVQAVRSRSLRGPYERVGGDVLLGENDHWKCMGHGTFIVDETQTPYYLFHGYSQTGTAYTGREGLLAELSWLPSGEPRFTVVSAVPDTAPRKAFFDFLSGAGKQPFWQWDYRHSDPQIALTRRGLEVTGSIAPDNAAGIVLSVRPTSVNYEVSASVDVAESDAVAQKGLVIYGDQNAAIGLGIKQQQLEFWRVEDGKLQALKTVGLPRSLTSLRLKLAVTPDLVCRAFYEDNGEWIEVEPEDNRQASIKSIVPWDRSPRPGLHFRGTAMEKAVFRDFCIENKP